jgi:adenosylmethionine-8-amino-7-oxononanoate aminotransferase
VVRGNGALLYRDEGPPLIDAISSWWVTLHGHAHPHVAEAIARQAETLEQVIFAEFTHPQAERLADRLAAKTGLERIFFSDNGSTAVEVALKIAIQWWHNKGEPRQQIIAFDGAYHGDTFGAMAVGARSLFSEPFDPLLFPVARIPWPATWWDDDHVEEHEQTALNQLEEALKTPTAAVILEPLVQGAGGMSMVRPTFLQEVEKRVRNAKTLLIADEVLTGFGRCGDFFGDPASRRQPRSCRAIQRTNCWIPSHGSDHGKRCCLRRLRWQRPEFDALAWPQFYRQPSGLRRRERQSGFTRSRS